MEVGNSGPILILPDILFIRHSPTFSWLRNQHREADFGIHFAAIEGIFESLGGDCDAAAEKRGTMLKSDSYIGGEYNCILEFDEFQHFSSTRAQALLMLPLHIPLGFSRTQYLELCRIHSSKADQYRRTKRTRDFDFDGGRTAQRAYFDCFRDLLPVLHGLRPTIRIAAFEVESITSNCSKSQDLLREIIKEKVAYAT